MLHQKMPFCSYILLCTMIQKWHVFAFGGKILNIFIVVAIWNIITNWEDNNKWSCDACWNGKCLIKKWMEFKFRRQFYKSVWILYIFKIADLQNGLNQLIELKFKFIIVILLLEKMWFWTPWGGSFPESIQVVIMSQIMLRRLKYSNWILITYEMFIVQYISLSILMWGLYCLRKIISICFSICRKHYINEITVSHLLCFLSCSLWTFLLLNFKDCPKLGIVLYITLLCYSMLIFMYYFCLLCVWQLMFCFALIISLCLLGFIIQ